MGRAGSGADENSLALRYPRARASRPSSTFLGIHRGVPNCKSGADDATETESTTASDTTGNGCVEPPFADDVPLAWSFCGCSDASPWYTLCGDGFFCEQAIVYESVPPVVVGGTCSPLCETDEDCAAYPVEGKTVVCGGHHCEILCDAGACAEGWTCQGNNCIETPEG